jgi:hypothetical protein
VAGSVGCTRRRPGARWKGDVTLGSGGGAGQLCRKRNKTEPDSVTCVTGALATCSVPRPISSPPVNNSHQEVAKWIAHGLLFSPVLSILLEMIYAAIKSQGDLRHVFFYGVSAGASRKVSTDSSPRP